VLGSAAILARRAVERRRLQARTTEALEREVAARTGELRRANEQLRAESERRAELDARYREAREELGQASRLASIGQISAGVAHEINQPLAAIRTYAENGLKLSEGGRHDDARDNLGRIVALTDRIGAITGELRAFSRRKTRVTGPATLGEAVDGLLLLLPAPARQRLAIDIPPRLLKAKVVGERIRLEQILVNLVQNAAEAVAGRSEGEIRLTADARPDAIDVLIADNGPGVSAEVCDSLFTPFATAKPEGLGLGLAIAREIAREFGGELVHLGERTDATVFRLTLVRRS
jgi:two-component system C4-dicarboxylate transport sensor histidine kinase DctB